jgi:catechol 2,3-dioxygenase-like lactoylglutathione lyase family enzyme
MLDHVSITVSDMHAAERFYDAIMKTLDVVKVGSRDDWLGYGERARPDYPDRVYLTIRKGVRPEEAIGRHWCFKAKWRKQVDAFWGAGIASRRDQRRCTGSARLSRVLLRRVPQGP